MCVRKREGGAGVRIFVQRSAYSTKRTKRTNERTNERTNIDNNDDDDDDDDRSFVRSFVRSFAHSNGSFGVHSVFTLSDFLDR